MLTCSMRRNGYCMELLQLILEDDEDGRGHTYIRTYMRTYVRMYVRTSVHTCNIPYSLNHLYAMLFISPQRCTAWVPVINWNHQKPGYVVTWLDISTLFLPGPHVFKSTMSVCSNHHDSSLHSPLHCC